MHGAKPAMTIALVLFVKSKHQHENVHLCFFGIINFDAFLSIKLKVQAKSVHAFGNASLGLVRCPLWR
jgi:hypothetical protein